MAKIFKKGDIVKFAETSGSSYLDSQPILFLKDSSCVDYQRLGFYKTIEENLQNYITKEENLRNHINLTFLTSGGVGAHLSNPNFLELCDDKFKEKLNYKILNEISKMITDKQSEEAMYDNISKLYVDSIRESLNKALNMINKEEN